MAEKEKERNRFQGIRAIVKTKHNASERAVPAATWIYNPWLDLIVGCGAWSAPLLLFSYLSIASSVRAWSVVFYALALFFNYPHYMATIYRAYHRVRGFSKVPHLHRTHHGAACADA